MTSTHEDMDRRINPHRLNRIGVERIAVMRAAAIGFANDILALVPDGREQDYALLKVEEALMFANAGIARNADFQVTP